MRPTIVIHDCLQTRLLSPAQQKVVEEKSMFEWFRWATDQLKGARLKLAIVANGIDIEPKWVQFIKDNEWEVQCHGLTHHLYKYLPEEEIYKELKEAKELIENAFNQRVTQFYPPKHQWDHNTFNACARLGLNLMFDRWRPIHLLEGDKFIPEVYIHHWQRKNVESAVKLLKK